MAASPSIVYDKVEEIIKMVRSPVQDLMEEIRTKDQQFVELENMKERRKVRNET